MSYKPKPEMRRTPRARNRPAVLPTKEALLNAFADFLILDVANGDAAPDTVNTYRRRLVQYVGWCDRQEINPALATKNDIKIYRRYLIEEKGQKPATISLTLSVIRRFYTAAVAAELIRENPAINIRPPREKQDAAERITYLNEIELKQFLAAISNDGSIKSLRDRALIAIMALQGPRTVEMHRASVGDLVRCSANWGLRVEGKRSIRTIPLRPDLARVLWEYLEARKGTGENLTPSSPLFIAVGNRFGGQRLSRRGIRFVVDLYLAASGLKHTEGRTLSAHSLRHTAGTLGLQSGSSLRQVQDLLGHSDTKTTTLYAHVSDRYANNPALGIGVEV